jgi:hypothetical protein
MLVFCDILHVGPKVKKFFFGNSEYLERIEMDFHHVANPDVPLVILCIRVIKMQGSKGQFLLTCLLT